MIMNQQINDFIAMAHRVGAAGLTICSSGNLSWRVNDDKVLVSGTGTWVPELRPDQVAEVDFHTGKLLNGVRPSMESGFHLGIMRERPEIKVVLHFQSPYATALACSKHVKDIDFNVTAEIPIHVGQTIPLIPYFRPGSPELASHVIEAMKDHDSVMLLKHGQVVCGKDFNEAFERAMFFEMACRIVVMNNCDPAVFTDAEIADLAPYMAGKH